MWKFHLSWTQSTRKLSPSNRTSSKPRYIMRVWRANFSNLTLKIPNSRKRMHEWKKKSRVWRKKWLHNSWKVNLRIVQALKLWTNSQLSREKVSPQVKKRFLSARLIRRLSIWHSCRISLPMCWTQSKFVESLRIIWEMLAKSLIRQLKVWWEGEECRHSQKTWSLCLNLNLAPQAVINPICSLTSLREG